MGSREGSGVRTEKSRQGVGEGENVKDPLSFTVQVTLVLRKRRNRAGLQYQLGMAHHLHTHPVWSSQHPCKGRGMIAPPLPPTPCSPHRGDALALLLKKKKIVFLFRCTRS